MKRSSTQFARRCNRRGTILILVLACCVVAVSLIAIAVQVSLQQRKHLRNEHQLEQTRWILDAAIRKTIADPPDDDIETDIEPKLEKFDKASFSISLKQDNGQVSVRAKIENKLETNVTARSASFELPD